MAFWLIQSMTGALIVFHWEIDDALLAGRSKPLNLSAIEKQIAVLAPEGSGRSVESVWESGSGGSRFDLYLNSEQGSSVVRINGAGEVLRSRADGEIWLDGGWIDTLVGFHHNLLGGEVGSWIVGLSGILLFTNILLGLCVAWPTRGRWRQALKPPAAKARPLAKTYGWHRSMGLFVAVPALATVGVGIMLVFEDQTASIIDPPLVEVAAQSWLQPVGVGFATAADEALAAFPGSRLSAVSMPSLDNASYRVRLLQPGENRRIYGTTTVFVNANDGRVIKTFDALDDGPARSFVDGLFPFHTGETGGLPGRVAILALGLWLITMIVLGAQLWWRRRRRRKIGPV